MWPFQKKKRVSEHNKSISNNNAITGFTEHYMLKNHLFGLNVKLLHQQIKGERMDFSETVEIKKALNVNKKILLMTNQTSMYILC